VQRLQEQYDSEQAAMAASNPEVRALAVRLHARLCPHPHPDGCTWYTGASHVDDPELTDWTESAHAAWLERARVGVACVDELRGTTPPPGGDEPG
jgi:hypothetical protein